MKERNALLRDFKVNKLLIRQHLKQNMFVYDTHGVHISPLTAIEPDIHRKVGLNAVHLYNSS